jgi:hypothetical protein
MHRQNYPTHEASDAPHALADEHRTFKPFLLRRQDTACTDVGMPNGFACTQVAKIQLIMIEEYVQDWVS